MPAAEPPRNLEELARLGAEVYDRHVRPALRPEDDGKFVAIDVGTGDFEIDEDDYAAVTRLRTRRPAAEIWLERAGQPTAYQIRSARSYPVWSPDRAFTAAAALLQALEEGEAL